MAAAAASETGLVYGPSGLVANKDDFKAKITEVYVHSCQETIEGKYNVSEVVIIFKHGDHNPSSETMNALVHHKSDTKMLYVVFKAKEFAFMLEIPVIDDVSHTDSPYMGDRRKVSKYTANATTAVTLFIQDGDGAIGKSVFRNGTQVRWVSIQKNSSDKTKCNVDVLTERHNKESNCVPRLPSEWFKDSKRSNIIAVSLNRLALKDFVAKKLNMDSSDALNFEKQLKTKLTECAKSFSNSQNQFNLVATMIHGLFTSVIHYHLANTHLGTHPNDIEAILTMLTEGTGLENVNYGTLKNRACGHIFNSVDFLTGFTGTITKVHPFFNSSVYADTSSRSNSNTNTNTQTNSGKKTILEKIKDQKTAYNNPKSNKKDEFGKLVALCTGKFQGARADINYDNSTKRVEFLQNLNTWIQQKTAATKQGGSTPSTNKSKKIQTNGFIPDKFQWKEHFEIANWPKHIIDSVYYTAYDFLALHTSYANRFLKDFSSVSTNPNRVEFYSINKGDVKTIKTLAILVGNHSLFTIVQEMDVKYQKQLITLLIGDIVDLSKRVFLQKSVEDILKQLIRNSLTCKTYNANEVSRTQYTAGSPAIISNFAHLLTQVNSKVLGEKDVFDNRKKEKMQLFVETQLVSVSAPPPGNAGGQGSAPPPPAAQA
jgi:hypothetical protein